ncbi:MAG: response regulator transcription factor [Bacteroidota bacterium]
MPVTIAIYEDNHNLRETISGFLNEYPEYQVVGAYVNGAGAFANTTSLLPDVAIVDIDMPEVDGIECTRQIKMANLSTQIIMHTVFEDDNKLFECLCAGANGYILKSATPDQLLDAINDVVKGGSPMSSVIARKVLDTFKQQSTATNAYNLSQREKEILDLLVKGYSYKMIASHSGIGFETVKTHLKNIYTKLHVTCGREAVAKAIKDRIV